MSIASPEHTWSTASSPRPCHTRLLPLKVLPRVLLVALQQAVQQARHHPAVGRLLGVGGVGQPGQMEKWVVGRLGTRGTAERASVTPSRARRKGKRVSSMPLMQWPWW